MSNLYEPPSWCGKPPVGLHLDVLKDGKMIQKLMIDEKKCYLFGRNTKLNDFCIDHASCSRVHSALLYHKVLNKSFLVDLNSTHGTFIGTIRLDSQKPTQLPIDSQFHFGASTRSYILRERPQPTQKVLESGGGEMDSFDLEGGLLGLPETENELDNLTEFNTAHNKRITMLGIEELPSDKALHLKRKQSFTREVRFDEHEDVINPEDVDPSVGRFRNMVQTSIIPSSKRVKGGGGGGAQLGVEAHGEKPSHRLQSYNKSQSFESYKASSLYANIDDDPSRQHHHHPSPYHQHPGHHAPGSSLVVSSLGMSLPNPAPDIDLDQPQLPPIKPAVLTVTRQPAAYGMDQDEEPKKKKYAKEAWPGKKPSGTLLV